MFTCSQSSFLLLELMNNSTLLSSIYTEFLPLTFQTGTQMVLWLLVMFTLIWCEKMAVKPKTYLLKIYILEWESPSLGWCRAGGGRCCSGVPGPSRGGGGTRCGRVLLGSWGPPHPEASLLWPHPIGGRKKEWTKGIIRKEGKTKEVLQLWKLKLGKNRI